MTRVKAVALVALAFLTGCASAPSGPVTAYEGARVIVGDGSVIENATLVVAGDKSWGLVKTPASPRARSASALRARR
jgi:hypothetical protein